MDARKIEWGSQNGDGARYVLDWGKEAQQGRRETRKGEVYARREDHEPRKQLVATHLPMHHLPRS